jgi:hypothetical protein
VLAAAKSPTQWPGEEARRASSENLPTSGVYLRETLRSS